MNKQPRLITEHDFFSHQFTIPPTEFASRIGDLPVKRVNNQGDNPLAATFEDIPDKTPLTDDLDRIKVETVQLAESDILSRLDSLYERRKDRDVEDEVSENRHEDEPDDDLDIERDEYAPTDVLDVEDERKRDMDRLLELANIVVETKDKDDKDDKDEDDDDDGTQYKTDWKDGQDWAKEKED